MHWAGGLFLCLFFVIILLWFIPLKFYVRASYQQNWQGEVTISALWFHHTIKFPDCFQKSALPAPVKRQLQNTSVTVSWHRLISFVRDAVPVMKSHITLEYYRIQCRAGFSRPDVTAYCYGAFWAVLAAIPESWLQRGEISFLPDFQEKRQELYTEGIIRCRTGQIIAMILSLYRLSMAGINGQPAGMENPDLAGQSV